MEYLRSLSTPMTMPWAIESHVLLAGSFAPE